MKRPKRGRSARVARSQAAWSDADLGSLLGQRVRQLVETGQRWRVDGLVPGTVDEAVQQCAGVPAGAEVDEVTLTAMPARMVLARMGVNTAADLVALVRDIEARAAIAQLASTLFGEQSPRMIAALFEAATNSVIDDMVAERAVLS